MRVTVTNPHDQSRPAELLMRPESDRDRETLERLERHYQCAALWKDGGEIVSVRVNLEGRE